MIKDKNKCKLVMVIQYSSSVVVFEGIRQFQTKHNAFFSDIKVFYVEDIESEKMSSENLRTELMSADLVMIDVRSNRITAKTLIKTLKDQPETNAVVLMGTGMEIQGLTRLGDFNLGDVMNKFAKKDETEDSNTPKSEIKDDIEVFHEQAIDNSFKLKIVYTLRKIMKIFGSVLPFGSIRKIKQVFQLMEWWESGKTENFICILEFVTRKYMGLEIERRKRQKPLEFYKAAFWSPEKGDVQMDITKYVRKYPINKQKPTLLIIMYGSFHFNHSAVAVKKIYEMYSKSWNIITFYTDGVFTTKYLYEYMDTDDPPFDAVLSLLWFPFNGGPGGGDLNLTHSILKKWNKPVFLGIGLYNQKYQDFLKRKEGLTPIQILASVIFPEMDGLIDGVPVLCSKSESITLSNQKFELVMPYAFEDNIEFLMKRISARINLVKKPNKDKKVAIMMLNYPPGEANIGSAAYFDGIMSAINLIKQFKDRDYDVEIPAGANLDKPQEFKDWLIHNGVVNTPRFNALNNIVNSIQSKNDTLRITALDTKKFKDWFETKLSKPLQKKVVKAWGQLPGDIQTIDNTIYLPIISFGNIYLSVQPSRGDVEDLERAYHDETLPPHYQYLAFYYYLTEELNIDAMIHLGTHGTLEFLPGKEVGLHQNYGYNYSMVDNIPHFYIYQISNTSEGMIAKRRSLGTLITYQLPEFIESNLNNEFLEIEEKIHLLEEAKSMENPTVDSLEQELLDLAKRRGIEAQNADEVAHEIMKAKTILIPSGLHIFGNAYTHKGA
ncbi:MAG: hypothetical protein GF364_08140, partial [Candidatus Lokiarchaeota archaeon]|nr:hypothetical protein [Candidatus Lokiarchaeota archaeon]